MKPLPACAAEVCGQVASPPALPLGKPRRQFAQRAITALVIQSLIAPTATVWHLPAAAQDAREGSPSACDLPIKQQPKIEEKVSDGKTEADDADDEDTISPDESTPNDAIGPDGGDHGDGGGASGNPGGSDGSGDDGEVPFGISGSFADAADGAFDAFGGAEFGGGSTGGGGGHIYDTAADPIDLRLASKRHVQVDYLATGASPLRVARVYHSNLATHPAQVTLPMGTGWRSYYDRTVQVISGTQVRLHRANGRVLDYTFNGSTWVSAMPGGALNPVAGGGWQYVNHRDQIELYASNGKLQSLGSGGRITTLECSGGQLWRVMNPFSRALFFGYDSAGRVAQVVLPDGNRLNYRYDSRGNLFSTVFTDGTTREYKYENASFPNALTGVVDESGRRRLTWGYDSLGRPNMGYYGTGSNRVDVAYYGDTVVTTDARGTQRTRTFGYVGGRRVITGIQTAATADSPATGWSFSYDGNGNPLQVISRTGEVRQLAHDGKARALSVTRAAGTSTALAATATWHPTYRKRTQSVALGITRNASIDAYGRVTALTMTGVDGVDQHGDDPHVQRPAPADIPNRRTRRQHHVHLRRIGQPHQPHQRAGPNHHVQQLQRPWAGRHHHPANRQHHHPYFRRARANAHPHRCRAHHNACLRRRRPRVAHGLR